jgi:predicted RNA-binding Zn-ribbon protein involved in translation (DUF1610 family)
MTDLLEKCEICGALLDEEDLFCANCGTEAPQRNKTEAPATEIATHNFECRGCGASMSYDASAQALRCPFCGNEQLDKQKDSRTLRPQRVVPFAVSQDQAIGSMRKWLGGSFWRPGDLAKRALVTKMTPVYVPYWVFSASTFTYWTGDSSQTPPGARGDWYPLSGEHRGRYQGVLIGSSSALSPQETSAICPFDLARSVPPEQVDLENSVCEQFRVPRKYARPLARQGLQEMERTACTQYVPGRSRNVKVNVRLEDMGSEPVLLPVWIMAYRYNDKLFRFLVNGQTGRAYGQAPTSWRKIAAVIGIVIGVILLIILLMMMCGGAAALFASTSHSSSVSGATGVPPVHTVSSLAVCGEENDAASCCPTWFAAETSSKPQASKRRRNVARARCPWHPVAGLATRSIAGDRFQSAGQLVNSCTSRTPLDTGITDAVDGAATGRTRRSAGGAEHRRLVARGRATHQASRRTGRGRSA